MKTTTKHKEKLNERQEAKKQAEVAQVLTVIEPDGGSVVVSDHPVQSSLRVFRLSSTQSIKPFEKDIADLFQKYANESGEDAQEAKDQLFEYIAYCNRAEVFFLVGVDKDFRCRAYCLAVKMPTNVFFIRQIVFDSRYGDSINGCWEYVENAALQSGCGIIEGNTRRDERVYGRWANRFGMKRACTIYRKIIRGN